MRPRTVTDNWHGCQIAKAAMTSELNKKAMGESGGDSDV
jgi:hypothetical protein